MDVQFFLVIIVISRISAEKQNTVKHSLDYVFSISPGSCGAGTGETLPLQFDVEAWNQYTDPAIRTANLLSKVMQRDNGTLDSLSDEFFFLLVRNNVHGASPIFGAAIAIETGVLSKYEAFCPYAYKKNYTVRAHDLSINYKYQHTGTVWYDPLKEKNWSNVTIASDRIVYRKGDILDNETKEVYPVVGLADGHWTNPYFDCGGGDVWMVTYSSPAVYINQSGHLNFKGLATIDIELTNIDINQCPDDDSHVTSGLDVFRGTHACQKSTKCVHVKGRGFTTGSYRCECMDGFYFPNASVSSSAYLGSDIENHVRRFGSIEPGKFLCAACAPGCETCVDASPCLFKHNQWLLLTLLVLTMLTVGGIIALMIFTYLNRNKKTIKSASPSFLHLMCLGGILLCLQFVAEYLDSSVTVCSIRIWPRHVGFVLLYGSLVLKTWRISMIFTVGTRKRVHLPDKVLLQRLGVLTLLTVVILTAWTISYPPVLDTFRISESLLYRACYLGPWEYALIGIETVLLLYGVYLCFTVRKAPAHFNESKLITYAIYNAIILGIILSLLPRFLLTAIGPDTASVFVFIQLQVFATITLLIIYVPKIFAVRKETGEQSSDNNTTSIRQRQQSLHSLHQRNNASISSGIVNWQFSKLPTTDKFTQTNWELMEDKDEDKIEQG